MQPETEFLIRTYAKLSSLRTLALHVYNSIF